MRLFDATLDLARYAQGTEQHKITQIAELANKFWCSSLSARMGNFTDGGTVWFLTGNSEGKFGSIMRGKEQMIETYDIFEDGFAVGDSVALSSAFYFNTQNLINAINHVLYDYPIMEIYDDVTDESIHYKHNQFEYELPEEVSLDIRRVEIQSKNWFMPWYNEVPDTFTVCHY